MDVSNVDANKIQSATENSGSIADQVFGNKDAKVVLVEYGDFQCPGCGSAHPTVKALSEKYKDQMAFVFRNFPLTNIHPNARAAAAAVEAAGKQGKYWEMHNIVFERQNEWSSASASNRGTMFANYADLVGIDRSKFQATLENDSASINRKINFDIAVGRKVGAQSTPTFFLNGRTLDGDDFSGEEAFEKVIQEEFKKQGVELPAETAAQ